MPTDEAPTILKRDALGRVTSSIEQPEALLDEFERSGLKGLLSARLVGEATFGDLLAMGATV
jgi:hypothetical protein